MWIMFISKGFFVILLIIEDNNMRRHQHGKPWWQQIIMPNICLVSREDIATKTSFKKTKIRPHFIPFLQIFKYIQIFNENLDFRFRLKKVCLSICQYAFNGASFYLHYNLDEHSTHKWGKLFCLLVVLKKTKATNK